MFSTRYWAGRYFSGRYWGVATSGSPASIAPTIPATSLGSGNAAAGFLPLAARWPVGLDLDWMQRYLHDEGTLWPREELLGWYRDGYMQLCARAQATRQWRGMDLPPRATVTYAHDWEQQYTWHGASQRIGYRTSTGMVCTYPWEVEMTLGVPVSDGAPVFCTQPWESAYLPDGQTASQHCLVAVPRAHERIARVYWDDKALEARSVRELDGADGSWWQTQGQPWVWSRGVGGQRHFELYQLPTDYQEPYTLRAQEATQAGGEAGIPFGIPRELYGDRAYGWTSDDHTLPVGVIREISSPERQYLAQPTWMPEVGAPREWRSSPRNLFVWEVALPDTPPVEEGDIPWLVPSQLQKYLRAYVLARCFGRQGEGSRPEMAAFYEERWLRGLVLMKRLGWPTRVDRVLQRQPAHPHSRGVARPRLPSDFPRYAGV